MKTDKKKIEIIITSILVIILIIGVIRIISTGKLKRLPITAAESMVFPSVSKTVAQEKLARIEAEAEKISWERNPFARSKTAGVSGFGPLDLTGILWDEETPNAIIGETIVKEGDVIGKYKIIKINKDNIVISNDEGEKILRIWQEE